MAIVYHFASPDIFNIILVVAYIILIFTGFQFKKKTIAIRNPNLFLISGIIGTIWFIISFLVPAYMFTTPPTAAEIQFTNIYSFVWHNLVPSLILIGIFGFINIILGLTNKENYGIWLLLSGILFIISVSFDLILPISILIDLIFTVIFLICIVLSSCFYLYFSIRIKNFYLITFSILFLFSLILPAIGLNLYIPIY